MPIRFHHHKLPNGLDIIAEHDPAAYSFAAGLFVRTGSRDETPELGGVSHFLEHMMFKGSDRYTWEDVNRIFDEMGARYNAFTTQEMTAYYANVLPEFTQPLIDHLSHLLRPAIRQADFEGEKNVVLEEIAMYQDEPSQRVYEKAMDAHFGGHPLGRPVIGTQQSVSALTRDQMAAYFNSHYGPGSMVLAVSGKFDLAEIEKLAAEYFGQLKSVKAPRDYAQPKLHPQQVRMTDAKLNRQYTISLTPGPSAQDPRRFAARVMGSVLGDAEGSRLYWALVDNAIAEDADFGFYPHDQCGSFYLSLATTPKRAIQAQEVAKMELARAADDLTEEEVTRSRNKIAGGLVLSGESPMGRLHAMGSEWMYNEKYRSLEDDLADLMKVDAAAIKSLMRDFKFEPMTTVTLGPQ